MAFEERDGGRSDQVAQREGDATDRTPGAAPVRLTPGRLAEIERLRSRHFGTVVGDALRDLLRDREAMAARVEALETHMRGMLTAPSGAAICACGTGRKCWYCGARTLLAALAPAPSGGDTPPAAEPERRFIHRGHDFHEDCTVDCDWQAYKTRHTEPSGGGAGEGR